MNFNIIVNNVKIEPNENTRIKRESILHAFSKKKATMKIVVNRKSVDPRIVRVQFPLPPTNPFRSLLEQITYTFESLEH